MTSHVDQLCLRGVLILVSHEDTCFLACRLPVRDVDIPLVLVEAELDANDAAALTQPRPWILMQPRI